MAEFETRFQVSWPGESYVYEPDEITMAELKMLEAEWPEGWSFRDWTVQIDRKNGNALQILVWFLRFKAGRVQPRIEVDDVKPFQIDITRLEDGGDDPEAPAASDAATSSPSSSPSG